MGTNWKWRSDQAALSQSGDGLSVSLPLMVRLTVNRYARFINTVLTMRQLPGGQSGHCGTFDGNPQNEDSGILDVSPAEDLFKGGLAGFGARQSLVAQSSNLEAGAAHRQRMVCTPAQRAQARDTCTAELGAQSRPETIAACVMDICETDPAVASPRDVAASIAETRINAREMDAADQPLKFTVLGGGQACPAPLAPAQPNSAAEAAAVTALLSSSPAGSTVCQPTRIRRVGALVETADASKACSTGLQAQQLAVVKSVADRLAVEAIVRAKSATRTVWLGGSFAAGRWQWDDGSAVTTWPAKALTAADAARGARLCMVCDTQADPTASVPCPFVPCGATAEENHAGVCESKIEA